jgi:hypothetical protein
MREAMTTAEAPFKAEDQALEHATVRTLRQERLKARVPALVQALVAQSIPTRQAVNAVALHTGLSEGYIHRIYFGRRK